LVFVNKYRREVLTGEHIRFLAEVCGKHFAASYGGAPPSIIRHYPEQQRTPGG
jgi:REP element-mobilizing transposase RayT